MSHLSRRQLLAGFLANLVQTAGTVVLARSVLAESSAQGNEPDNSSQASLAERADKLACEQGPLDEEDLQPARFVNGGFRNGGGFRKSAFGNGGGGGFRNGGFRNGGGGGFRNGGFANGGGFRNGAFRN